MIKPMSEKQAWWEFEAWLADNSFVGNREIWAEVKRYSQLMKRDRRKKANEPAGLTP